MISFMFGVLGSLTFWIFYACISMFMGTLLIRYLDKTTWDGIRDGHIDYINAILMFWSMLMWPLVLIVLTIYWTFKYLIGPIIIKGLSIVVSLVSAIPEVEIKQKEREN